MVSSYGAASRQLGCAVCDPEREADHAAQVPMMIPVPDAWARASAVLQQEEHRQSDAEKLRIELSTFRGFSDRNNAQTIACVRGVCARLGALQHRGPTLSSKNPRVQGERA